MIPADLSADSITMEANSSQGSLSFTEHVMESVDI